MNGLQYTHQIGACRENDCTIGKIGKAPQKCPEGHSGPFHHTLIALPEGGAEWWFHCHHKDPKEDGWCDQRFPGPKGPKGPKVDFLVSPEMYDALVSYFPEQIVLGEWQTFEDLSIAG